MSDVKRSRLAGSGAIADGIPGRKGGGGLHHPALTCVSQIWPRLLVLLVLSASISAFFFQLSWQEEREAVGAGMTVVGIDVNTSGNTATFLGPVEDCVTAARGTTLQVDVFVNEVPAGVDLGGFNYILGYDSALGTITSADHLLLLNSSLGSNVLDLGDAPPDSDGSFVVGVADFGTAETGPVAGVLGRYSIQVPVTAPTGILSLTLSSVTLSDGAGNPIPVDLVQDGASVPSFGQIAIGQGCPSDADLRITKSDSPDPAVQGTTITYLLDISNLGPASALNVVTTDRLPSQLTLISASPSQGACSNTGNAISCSLGAVAASDSVSVSITAQVNGTFTGQITNQASVSADTPDPFPANNTSSQTTTITEPTPTPPPPTPTPTATPIPTPTPSPTPPPVTTLGIDANPTGNTATKIGSVDSCASMAVGQEIGVDIFIMTVTDLAGWSSVLTYDRSVINVTAVDVRLFQAADGSSVIFNASDPVPDDDGSYTVSGIDLSAPPHQDSGRGVLARLTLIAVGTGESALALGPSYLTDANGIPIKDDNGDTIFDGPELDATVNVGGLCPGQTATPTATPPPLIVTSIGLDVDPAGNAPTSLGPLDTCREIPAGESFQIDFYITQVIELAAWSADLAYNVGILRIDAVDVRLFQAADGASNIFNASDPVPDSNGSYLVSAVDLSAPPKQDSGTGVLARITITAVGSGTSLIGLTNIYLVSANGTPIGDSTGDGVFDGASSSAEIRIGATCPIVSTPTPSATPVPTPNIPTFVAMDARVAGNTAKSLGQVDNCASFSQGQQFVADIAISQVQDLQGWAMDIQYTSGVLRVDAIDVRLFQAADGTSNVFSASDSTPDVDGLFTASAIDLSAPPNQDSGSGVLARLTFTALGNGNSPINIAGVSLVASSGAAIGDVNGDGIFDGPVFSASVEVGGLCPGESPPSPTPTPAPITTAIAVDADSRNNGPASLGPLNSCLTVTANSQVSVDITITNVSELQAWHAGLQYDATRLRVDAINVQMFQAADGRSSVLNSSDPVPDTDGAFSAMAVDITAPPNQDSGSGVLFRVTFSTLASGLAPVSIDSLSLTDAGGQPIGDANGDGLFDGAVSSGEIAVGTFCPGVSPPVTSVGVDTKSTGNTATVLGAIEQCNFMRLGASLDVDIFVTNVSDLLGWSSEISYDPTVLRITAINVDMFQNADGQSRIFNASDPAPDSDGLYTVSAIDLAAPPHEDSGSGVLVRVTFTSINLGLSSISLGSTTLTDVNGLSIGDVNGDGSFDGTVYSGLVGVEQFCPGTPPVATQIGIDADPTGNTATSLGTIDSCRSVSSGTTFAVDLFIRDVTDLAGWAEAITYDQSVVSLQAIDVRLFQAADGASNIFNASDPLPDSDGAYSASAIDLNAPPRQDSGSGVLARLTLLAVAAGSSDLRLSAEIVDVNGNPIGDVNGDRIFDGGLFNAQVKVDQPCVP